MSDAIRIERLSKKYRIYDKKVHILYDSFLPKFMQKLFDLDTGKDIWILKELNLTVKKGERLGIIGENGTGKSTLLKLICQYIKPNDGSIVVYGKSQSLLSLGAGFLPNLNAYQNIEAYFAFNNVDLDHSKVDNILDFAELAEYANQPIKIYSSGMFARFAFAVMTEIKPEIFIIDEVLGAGDAYFLGKCVARLNRLTQDENMTLIFVSHDMSSVQQVCSRAIWLHKGYIKTDDIPLHTIKEYQAYMRNKENIRLMEKQISAPINTLNTTHMQESVLFRIIAVEDNYQHFDAAIYKIELEYGELRELLEIGNSLDNDVNQSMAIIEAPGKTDWGKPDKDSNGYYRPCLNYKSQFHHAPFIARISPFLRKKNEDKQGTIGISYKSNVDLRLQVYNEITKEYVSIGELGATNSQHANKSLVFSLPTTFENLLKPDESLVEQVKDKINQDESLVKQVENEINQDENLIVETVESLPPEIMLVEPTPHPVNSSYGSQEMYIKKVEILDEHGIDTRILLTEKPYKIRIHYYTDVAITNPVFVFCIYTPDGLCVSQFLEYSKSLGKEIIDKSGYIDFVVANLIIGAKDYVASVAIFKRLNVNKQEPEAYHVLDRCVFFKVEDSFSSYERGICLQSYQATIEN